MQGGEGVICNAWASVRNGGDEGRLSRVRHAQEADIRQHLELELKISFLARPAGCLLAGRTVDGALKAQISKPAVTALGNGDHLAGHQQFKQHLSRLRVADDGAHRHFESDVVTRRAKHVRAHAVFSALGIVATRKAVIHQRVQVRIGDGVHMAAAAAVSPIGAAKFFVFFMPKRYAASATVSGRDVYVGFVNELHAFLDL